MQNNLLKILISFIVGLSFFSQESLNAADRGLWLVKVEHPKAVNAGEGFDLIFYLKPLEPLKRDYQMFIHLNSIKTRINADITLPYPSSRWQADKVIKVGPVRVYIPPDTTAGNYYLQAGLFWTEETKFGRRFKRLPFANRSLINNWQLAKLRINPVREEILAASSPNQEHSLYVQNSLEKVFPEKPHFLGRPSREVNLTTAKNEYESVQISFLAKEAKTIELVKSDLTHQEEEAVIAKENIKLFLVGYVNSKKPYYNTPRVGLWPDPLIPLRGQLNIEEIGFKTVWVEIYIPASTPAGKYSGKIDIIRGDEIIDSLKVNLLVWDFVLPDTTHLKTAFDLREYILFDYYPKRPGEGESEYEQRMEQIKKAYNLDMLKHRLNPVHNMGNPKFLGKEGEVYKLDFSDFDKRVKFYSAYGQQLFSIGEYWPWQSTATWGKWYGLKSERSVLGVFKAYGEHLKNKGWLDKAYAYIFDETFYRVKEVTALIHQAHPGIKNLLTMAPDLTYTDIDIWVPRINNLDPGLVEKLKSEGKEVWIYVAGTTRPYPNLNLDVMSIEYRILPWICWKFNLQGLLYWATNWWVRVNPWESGETFSGQNGNGSLYYPGQEGPIGSLRLKVLRDGLEDYEFFYILQSRLKAFKQTKKTLESAELIKRAEQALALSGEVGPLPAYYTHHSQKIIKKREQIASLIEEINAALKKRGGTLK